MEHGARQVQIDSCTIAVDGDVDGKVGIGAIDIGTFSTFGGEPVTDGVLDFDGGELGIAKRCVLTARMHGNRGARRDDPLPGNLAHAGIERVRTVGARARDLHQHARGHAAPETDAQAIGIFPCKRRTALDGLDAFAVQADQLIGQHVLEPAGTAGEESLIVIAPWYGHLRSKSALLESLLMRRLL